VTRPFVAISGDNTWGDAIPIVGSADDPTAVGDDSYFDLHHILISDSADATVYLMRLIYGTGTSGNAISAGQYSELLFLPGTGPKSTPVTINVPMPRVAVGQKVWVQVWNATNLSEIDFFWKCHGYPG